MLLYSSKGKKVHLRLERFDSLAMNGHQREPVQVIDSLENSNQQQMENCDETSALSLDQ
jgi:hypothetical protein